MRARYYSPALRRFINADIIPGEISNAITLNRYAYANGNPVSNVDPFGLSVERGNPDDLISEIEFWNNFNDAADGFELIIGDVKFVKDGNYINITGDQKLLEKYGITKTRIRTNDVRGFKGLAKFANVNTAVSRALKSKSNWAWSGITIAIEASYDMSQYDEWGDKLTILSYDVISGVIGSSLSIAGAAAVGAKVGTAFSPGLGTLAGVAAGYLIGALYDAFVDEPVKKYVEICLTEE